MRFYSRVDRFILSLFLSTLFFVSTTSYGEFGYDYTPNLFSLPNVITLSAGPVWGKVGSQQVVYLTPSIVKSYTADRISHSMPDGEIFIGTQKCLYQQLQAQLGLALAAAGNARRTGQIWDDTDPEFNNYVFSYQIYHAHVALKGKLLIDDVYWFIPWISGSIGAGLNRSYSYHSAPTIFEAVPMPPFKPYSQASFTYTVGAGIQIPLNACWQIGAGYEFADWGKSLLGRSVYQVGPSRLGSNHVFTNGVMFNMTFLF